MEILDSAFEYIQEKSDKDILEDKVSINTQFEDVTSFEVCGRYEDSSILGTSKETVEIEKSSELHAQIRDVFDRVIEGLNVKNGAEVTTIRLERTSEWSKMDYPFYTSADADAQFFIGVSKTTVPEKIKDELKDMVVSLLSEWDESVCREYIDSCDWFFDDLEILELLNVSGTVRTQYPTRYYDVESVEEFVDKSGKDNTVDQKFYDVDYKCGVDPNNSLMEPITKEMKDRVEEIMWNHVNSTINTYWDYKVEGEVIQFGEYSDYDEEELMKYYLYLPVFTGDREL